MDRRRVRAVIGALFAVGLAAGAMGCGPGATPSDAGNVCRPIYDLCHEADTAGTGFVHECHEMSEANPLPTEWCTTNRDRCLEACRAAAEAGTPTDAAADAPGGG